MSCIRAWRRLVQAAVVVLLILVPLLNLKRIHFMHGNLLAFNFGGLPLGDPLAALQVALISFSAGKSMLPGAGLVLLMALLLGPVFCSWLCPYGFLSELVHVGRGRKGKQARGDKNSHDQPVRLLPFLLKTVLALFGLFLAVFALSFPWLNQFSLPGWFSRLFQHLILYREVLRGAGLIALVLLLEAAAGKRFWCRWICPQSVLLGLAGTILPARLQVRFLSRSCTCSAKDRPCLPACSLGLNPRKAVTSQRLQCTNCGDCVQVCQSRGKALSFGFGRKKQQNREVTFGCQMGAIKTWVMTSREAIQCIKAGHGNEKQVCASDRNCRG